ncbi:hypothetical protein [Pedobacter nutrimenti]|uniref:Uncharacterized protein n=1 Tax=Pedobacter nutrimenti TaxID=1241337 RepID=A0A318UAK6_9SPHI|nr:hypothetical protein [Pedobacter nutrimenti]PYF68487.1 hypothetical protein B0O44_11274 [Pedobacter nutrimenti]
MNVKDKIKEVLKNEDLTWEKLAELDGGQGKGSYRQNLIKRVEKLQSTFDLIGYEIVLKKVK